MKRISLSIGSIALLAPTLIFAKDVTDVPDLIKYIVATLNSIVPIVFALALLAFLWGVYKYVIAADVKSKADGRTFIIYGVIGLAVMLSVWGLANFVKNSFFQTAVSPLEEPLPVKGSNNGSTD